MSQKIVLDNSVVMSWLFDDENNHYSTTILNRFKNKLIGIVPSLFWYEMSNVLLVGERRKRITKEDSKAFLDLISALPLKTINTNNIEAILDLARINDLSSYDASYLALSLEQQYKIATLDKKLSEVAKKYGLLLEL